MKALENQFWVLLAILVGLTLAHVVGVVNPNEKVNGLWGRGGGLYLCAGLSVLWPMAGALRRRATG